MKGEGEKSTKFCALNELSNLKFNIQMIKVEKNGLYVDGLKHNLLRISQLCDKGFKIEFNKNCCLNCEGKTGEVVHIGKRVGNVHMLNIEHTSFHEHCLVSNIDDSWLWHRRVAHIIMRHLNHLVRKEENNIYHLKVFGCKCFVLNNGKEPLRKFDAKVDDETIFHGYSSQSKAYKVFNSRILCVEESVHGFCDETKLSCSRKYFGT